MPNDLKLKIRHKYNLHQSSNNNGNSNSSSDNWLLINELLENDENENINEMYCLLYSNLTSSRQMLLKTLKQTFKLTNDDAFNKYKALNAEIKVFSVQPIWIVTLVSIGSLVAVLLLTCIISLVNITFLFIYS